MPDIEATLPASAGPRPRGARLTTGLAAARAAGWLSRRVTGGTGRTIGGRVLLAVDPQAPAALGAGRVISMVSGTNGKSTTTAMLAAATRAQFPTETNSDGANTRSGIVTALSGAPTSHVVLEVDEGWLPWAITQLKPRCVVLLNLSRDQLHRNPEVHRMAVAWREALADVPLAVANADDPGVAWAAGGARSRIWVAAGQAWTSDSVTCPACGGLLRRDGSAWSCDCGLARPTAAWTVEGGRVLHEGRDVGLRLDLPGEVNLGNAALALAAATASGVPLEAAVEAVAGVRQVAGRYARLPHGDQSVRLVLAKNPAGWDAALHTLEESTAPLVVAFNAEGVDGLDPSWLYDVDFERLSGRSIAVCGRRATDMLVRLRLDGLEPIGQFDSLEAALRALPAGDVDVIANYSAFQQARRVLRHGG